MSKDASTKYVPLKVPKKYEDKVKMIVKYPTNGKLIPFYYEDYIYVAFLAKEYRDVNHRSELFAMNKQELFKAIEKLEKDKYEK